MSIVCKPDKFHHCRCLGIALQVFSLCLLFSGNGVAATDSLSLLVHGKSIYVKKSAKTGCNETNWGLGFQYEFANAGQVWVPFAADHGFKDSKFQASYYASAGYMRRLMSVHAWNQLHRDAGLTEFVVSRQGFKDGYPFVGALPTLSPGGRDAPINVTYSPRVHTRTAELRFFQLKFSTINLV